MLESYARSSQEVKKILCEKQKLDKISKIDDDVVNQLIGFLKPFSECAEILSGDKYPTIHLVALWHYKLNQHIDVRADDSSEIKLLKEQCRRCMQEYLNLEDLHYIACTLDPHYRKLTFVEEEKRERAVGQLKILMEKERVEVPVDESTSTADSNRDLEPPSPKVGRFIDLQDPDDNDGELSEIDKYFAYKLPKESEFDILCFWKSAKEFPTLQKIAKWLLAVPASQASDERVFSTIGKAINPLRTSLSGGTLSQLTLIHKNF
ncbi:zinc finger BED domain-containing protein 1-like [Folsomia candida]|uniref:Zinc finger BED domain-containing protein 1 n=1 Tax=Folsomia candida TaxID=158441 RepID=A0A226D1U6_FOLCA|nr:zinc finger BED domain-containing protein 1-like [Folsomia candida]OXA39143.1 Zinc finger BED domain-containing protein 1 [Folsomia candida]